MRLRQVYSDRRGLGAVEFALAAPVFLSMVIGISQLGMLYFANAGLKHAVDEAARRAAIYPVPPTNDTMLAALNASRFGMSGTLTPTIVRDTAAKTIDITLSYSVPLNFVFFETRPITLTHSRKIFTQAVVAASTSPAPSTATPTTPTTTTPTTEPPPTTPTTGTPPPKSTKLPKGNGKK